MAISFAKLRPCDLFLFFVVVPTDLCHADPFLQQPGSLLAAQLRRPQAGRQDGVGQLVELAHGGPDGPANAFPPLLVPLRPE